VRKVRVHKSSLGEQERKEAKLRAAQAEAHGCVATSSRAVRLDVKRLDP
jgi:Lhr-like helicase